MMSNAVVKETACGRTPSLNAIHQSLQETAAQHDINLDKDFVSKKEQVDKGSMHDRFDLLGDVGTLLRDVKENNSFHSVKPILEVEASSGSSQNCKQSDVQSPDDLIQSISNIFNRSHHSFLKKITTTDLNSLMSDYDNQSDTFGMPFLPLTQDILSCEDPTAIVRCAALETRCDILPLVRDFPPSDAKIFPEYIPPMLYMLPDDPEESVRMWYACNISKLELTTYGFLIPSISLSEAGVLSGTNSPQKSGYTSTDTSGKKQTLNSVSQLTQLRKSIADAIQELVMGPKQAPNIRRALLHGIGNLCWSFGQRQSNDFLLPILPAFLNDRDEQLRAVFYGQIIYVCFFVGQRSVEEYLLPYIEQALSDLSKAVIVNALDFLAFLCKSGF